MPRGKAYLLQETTNTLCKPRVAKCEALYGIERWRHTDELDEGEPEYGHVKSKFNKG